MVNQNKGGLQGKRNLFGKPEANDIPANLDIIQFNIATQQWELVSGVVGNAVQNGANVGTGEGVFKNRTGDDLNFKTLVQNSEILISGGVDEISFSVGLIAQSKIVNLVNDLLLKEDKSNKGIAGGYAGLDGSALLFLANIPALPISQITGLQIALDSKVETASNKGTGVFSFIQKTLTDLEFRSLLANTEILITQNALDLAFSIGVIAQSKITGLVSALATKLETLTNVGLGVGIAKAKIGTNNDLKSLVAGTNISVVSGTDDITINNTAIAPTIPTKGKFVMGYHADKSWKQNTTYGAMFTNKADEPVEAEAQGFFNFAYTVVEITCFVSVNIDTGAGSITLKRNSVAIPATTITIPALTTGKFSVSVSEAFAVADEIHEEHTCNDDNDIKNTSYYLECESDLV